MSFLRKRGLEYVAGTFLLSMALLAFAGLVAYSTADASRVVDPILHKGEVRMKSNPLVACDKVPGLCDTERRLLLSRTDARALSRLKKQGCKVRHELKDLTSLTCPNALDLQEARLERAFRVEDLISDRQIQVPGVWEAGIRGEGVRVAVLDTGVQVDHPELQGTVIAQMDFTGTGLQDRVGHGTHVAGILAGAGVTSVAENTVAGVSPQISLLSGKVCRDDGWCLEGDILAGIEWAVREQAKVVNLSLGGGVFSGDCDGDVLANKVNWAVDQGVVVVAAAGNDAQGVASPACASRAIAVGAVNTSDELATWSGQGKSLDLVAPGVSILSSYSCEAAGVCPGVWYAEMSGTSMAAPHVAAAAALLLERHPALGPLAIADILTRTAKDFGLSGPDSAYGQGRIDAYAAYQRSELVDPVVPDKGCLDVDGDGVDSCSDCQDTDQTIYPGAPEQCNKRDDNCNGVVDELCQVKDDVRKTSSCGNGICEGTENKGSCAADCVGVVPPRAVEASDGHAGGTGTGTEAGSATGSQAPTSGSSSESSGSSAGASGGQSSEGNGNSHAQSAPAVGRGKK